MKKFVREVLLFITPFAVIGLLAIIFYLKMASTHEFWNVEKAAEEQRTHPNILVGYAYNEDTPYLKKINANYYHANIIALGTSRVMQFRKDFFSEEFYNTGGAVSENFDQYLNFMQNLSYKPDIILLGLDMWVFNNNWNEGCRSYDNFIEIKPMERDTFLMLKSMFNDYRAEKWNMDELRNYPQNIGINALVKEEGFMADGSYFYGNVYREPERQQDYNFKNTYERIDKGIIRFEYGEHIDDETIQKLRELLNYCAVEGIEVIGFIPPLAPSVYKKIADSGNYAYVNEIMPACSQVFKEFEFEVYDYLDGSVLGLPDDYYVDGFHGGDIVYMHILKDIGMKTNSELKEMIEYDKINTLINKRQNNLTYLSY